MTLTLIATLIALLLPSMALVNETTRRVVCASNLRQAGLAEAIYADDYRGSVPPSLTDLVPKLGQLSVESVEPHQVMTTARWPMLMGGMPSNSASGQPSSKPTYVDSWVGQGLLVSEGYLSRPDVLYCPSYNGDAEFPLQAPLWNGKPGVVVTNYAYRGNSDRDSAFGGAVSIDGLSGGNGLTHGNGSSVRRNDLSVAWVSDANGAVVSSFLQLEAVLSPTDVDVAWRQVDKLSSPSVDLAPVDDDHGSDTDGDLGFAGLTR
ncbi:MAG: hypothetical protein AAF747_01340 [Planctomycetota bacterium]